MAFTSVPCDKKTIAQNEHITHLYALPVHVEAFANGIKNFDQ